MTADSGDAGARSQAERRLEQLLERHGGVLARAIGRTCPPGLRRLIDDIEQEARLRLWRALQSERILRQPESYVYRVGVNATLDAIRRVRTQAEVSLAADSQVLSALNPTPRPERPDSTAQRREFMEILEKCLQELPTKRQAAVRLYLQGFSSTEIGELRGWSEAKARNLTYRGRRDLRRSLRERGIDYEVD